LGFAGILSTPREKTLSLRGDESGNTFGDLSPKIAKTENSE
jgi:hypothetical protein